MKKIILTGGGSAGHVTPHFALLHSLRENQVDILYIGSKDGIEKKLVKDQGLRYLGISSGKLRRYFDVKNFTDPFRIIAGFFQALSILRKEKPDLVFSKGGFVSVPVVMAAKFTGTSVIIHESDMTPGLANKLAQPFATRILTTFEETLAHLPKKKSIYTGSPIRSELASGNSEKGYAFTGLSPEKPILMMMGGSLGARKINDTLREALPEILTRYQVIHLCGKGNIDPTLNELEAYRQYEYISSELKDLFAITDMVLSRAGSNAISEFAFLRIPSLLIPLSMAASRGDQILNAKAFEKKGYAKLLFEEEMNKDSLTAALDELYAQRDYIHTVLQDSNEANGTKNVLDVLYNFL
ncbi:MAG: undecaprenyldiphospho-muramoylpentapeptide beta-N-acetylglucosaminyltransferase [Vallitaleaceae bacterium]|nr:undecaprenyldiphospho-muramoylpentapeptide beta-N-acetylglucosaminyltransferase [Vallitaleaceae bacterium]